MQSVSAGLPANSAYARQQARLAGRNRLFVPSASRLMFKASDASTTKDDAVEKPAASNHGASKPRTRLDVLKDVSTRYFTKGGVILDLVVGTVLGALFAIGSPVMVVTIPTTLAVLFAIKLVAWSTLVCRDPNGEYMNRLYKNLEEYDEKMSALTRQESHIRSSVSAEQLVGNTD
jgi:hypothetical protein